MEQAVTDPERLAREIADSRWLDWSHCGPKNKIIFVEYVNALLSSRPSPGTETEVEALMRVLALHVAGPHGSVMQRNNAERAARAVLYAMSPRKAP